MSRISRGSRSALRIITVIHGWRVAERNIFTLLADGAAFTPDVMEQTAAFEWRAGAVTIRIEESEAADGSHAIVLAASGITVVEEVCLLDAEVAGPTTLHNHVWMNQRGMQQSTAVFARHGDGTGAFACYANPFGVAAVSAAHVRLAYRPGLRVDGSFRSDALVVGPVRLTGRELRLDLLPGRDTVGGAVVNQVRVVSPSFPVSLDSGESTAVRRAVAARVPWDEPWARVSHWDWGENLYRRPLSDPATRQTYDRVAALCGELGVEVVVLSPAARAGAGVDIYERGPWQYLMFLAQGLAVSEGAWDPSSTPDGLTAVLASFRSHGVGTAVYTNPLVDYLRRPEWRHQPLDHVEGTELPERVCLGASGVGEWFVEMVAAFASTYGLDGISLDFVSWYPCASDAHDHVPGRDSPYAQWDGWRRVVAALERRGLRWRETLLGSAPVAPWGTHRATHPHPVLSDNQPQWVPAWPDLSQDRANAHHQRRAAWWYRNLAFLPTYKIPGQVGHQANRRRPFPTERGWDWEGARFNLLSSIATAPSSTVVCFLPGWDEDEWLGMRARDGAFFGRWLQFARDHADVLARMEDLYGDARPGAVDGTVALGDDGRGFVFLANPDYERRRTEVPLADGFLLREVHPEPGRLWHRRVWVERNEVAVLEVLADDDLALPLLIGARGEVDGAGCILAATGSPGVVAEVEVRSVGGTREHRLAFADDGVSPTLSGWVGADGEPVDLAAACGDVVATTTWAPGASLPQLLATLAPPVAPVGDEVLQPWSDPSRLRLFPQILDPRQVTVRVAVNDETVPVQQAYIGTYEGVADTAELRHNLLGHYIDLTDRLAATEDLDEPWTVRLEIDGLETGRWMGMHVAHLPRRVTNEWRLL